MVKVNKNEFISLHEKSKNKQEAFTVWLHLSSKFVIMNNTSYYLFNEKTIKSTAIICHL